MDHLEHSDDPDAEIVALLTSHQAALRLYVCSLLPGDPEASDVTQQANITVWKKRGDFASGTNFKAWLFSIARFEVLNYRKRKAKDARLVFSDEMDALIGEELPQYSEDFDARRTALAACIDQLKPKQKALLQHRYAEKTSLKEYAIQVRRSYGGLKVTLHRIRKALAICIENRMKPPSSSTMEASS